MNMPAIRFLGAPTGWGGADRKIEIVRMLLLPAVVGIVLGWTGSGTVDAATRVLATFLWIAQSTLGWLAAHVGTRLICRPARKWGFPLWATLAAGLLAAGPATLPINLGMGSLFAELGFQRRGIESLSHFSLADMLSSSAIPMLMWVGINLAFHRFARLPMYGYAAAARPEAAAAPAKRPAPPFMQKMRPALRGRIFAVEAELHYIRVHTEHGSDLFLYRFSDAVGELSQLPGAQVHRSWWVADDVVVRRSARIVELANGLNVPIGRSFRPIIAEQNEGMVSG